LSLVIGGAMVIDTKASKTNASEAGSSSNSYLEEAPCLGRGQ
jgi:hypothetical protein